MASFSGQVVTLRWNTGISETPLPSPPRKFPSFEGGGSQDPLPFYVLPFSVLISLSAPLHRPSVIVR